MAECCGYSLLNLLVAIALMITQVNSFDTKEDIGKNFAFVVKQILKGLLKCNIADVDDLTHLPEAPKCKHFLYSSSLSSFDAS